MLAVWGWAVLGLVALALPSPTTAQIYHLRQYMVDDGLPSSQVRDVTQDSGGRMWFATHAGIASYDGRTWKSYHVAEGLSWADQFALRWDDSGRLWSVSSIAPFRIYRYVDHRWYEEPGPGEVSTGRRITAFDTIPSGSETRLPRLAIGTTQGLLLGDGASWQDFGHDDGLPADQISALAWWEGRLLIATTGGLAELRRGQIGPALNEIRAAGGAAEPLGAVAIYGLAVDHSEPARLWIVGEDWIGRLQEGHYQVVAEQPNLFRTTPLDGLRTQPDHQGGLYFADRRSLIYFHPELGFEWLGRSNGLPEEGASSLWLDREENLWVGGQRGVTKIVDRRFGRYTRQHGLLDDQVTATYERRDGEIVLGHRGGISRLLPSGEVRALILERSAPIAGSAFQQPERVRDLTEDRSGNLWIAVDSFGLARLNANDDITWWGSEDGLRGAVTAVLVDSRQQLWVATDEGLFKSQLGEQVLSFEDQSSGHPLHVRRLFPGAAGKIVLATASGLQVLDGTDLDAKTCSTGACRSVFAVLPTDGGLWAGTAAGLYQVKSDDLVAVESPAIERPIFFMVRDLRQRVWFGTDNGVLRWDGDTLRHLTVRDGLAGRETYRSAGMVTAAGDVWIGTDRGVSVYSERIPGPRRKPPIVELSRVDASGKVLPLDSELFLDHDENDLIFHFRVTSLVDEERLRVEHCLEGDESEWRPLASTADGMVRYTNLAPGEYRLKLRAANAEGLWSEIAESATITVARPYWQQTWFFLVLATAMIAAVYGAQRLLAQRRYSRRLEAEVAERVEELRASEERYRHVFERSQAVKLLLDEESLQILDVNRAACRFYGHSPEDLRQRTLHDLRVEDPADLLTVGTGSGTHLLAERHRSAGGTVHDVELYFSSTEAEGRPIFYVIVQDVTERRLAEESMSTERARLAVTLRNIDNGVLTTDAEGKILLANRRIAEITGWAEEDMVGRRLGEILRLHAEGEGGEPGRRLHIPMSDEVLQPVRSAVLVTVSGEYRLVELSGSLIRRPDGEVSGMVLAIRNVTERRQIEAELAKTQKLEAVGLLAGGIAHDFNNLLTVLLGNLSLLDRDLAPDSRQAKNLANAETAVLRARDLTQQLLTFSRGGTPILEAASINEVIEESSSFVLSGSKVICEIDLPADLWVVEIDAGQIHQVINNLLLNAVQAMPEGGTIRIEGENLDPTPQSLPQSLPPGRYIAIHVADQGVGIRRQHLERIFDPYFSTKERGRGLGLASAYSIVKQHEGLLTVESEPGLGTTFSLYLPASQKAITERRSARAASDGNDGRILIMDDDREVREITGRIIKRLGYKVAFAADGMQAIARYNRALDSEEPFDAVIMDLTVRGGMGGKTAVQHLRDLDPSVRVIVASGYSNDPVLAQYRQYGFRGRITKPFRSEDLARVLDEVLTAEG